jgi:hypothetical protein
MKLLMGGAHSSVEGRTLVAYYFGAEGKWAGWALSEAEPNRSPAALFLFLIFFEVWALFCFLI